MSDNDTREYLSALSAVGRNATAEVERLATDNKRLRAINAELLAALEAVVPFTGTTGPLSAMAYGRALAAIAKAKGE